MARQVYFDPFGSYTKGYDSGVSREMQVQDNTRRARAQDFNYNYMMPLEYRQAQRMDALGEFSLPFQKRAVQYADQLGRNNVYTSNQDINREVGVSLGITQPYEDEIARRFNITPQVQQFVSNPNPNVTAAKDKYIQQLANYDAAGMELTPELRQSIAQQMATYYNVSLDDVLNPIAIPRAPQPEVVYTMQGPDGQPVVVGRVVNPRQQLLDQWHRSQAMETAREIYGMGQDYLDRVQAAEEAARSQQYLQLQQGYFNRGNRPAASTGSDSSIIPGAF